EVGQPAPHTAALAQQAHWPRRVGQPGRACGTRRGSGARRRLPPRAVAARWAPRRQTPLLPVVTGVGVGGGVATGTVPWILLFAFLLIVLRALRVAAFFCAATRFSSAVSFLRAFFGFCPYFARSALFVPTACGRTAYASSTNRCALGIAALRVLRAD